VEADDGTVQWEYSYLTTATGRTQQLVETINDLGVEGWQLVTMDDVDRTIGLNELTAILRRRIAPLPPPDDLADGWYPDPSGRFDLRDWNGRAWTFHVARTADKSTHRDPPTALTPTPDLHQ
jgi:hypothetical protein